MKLKLTQGNLLALIFPCIVLSVATVVLRTAQHRREQDLAQNSFESLSLIVENLKQNKSTPTIDLLYKTKTFQLSFPEKDEEANLRILALEASIRFLFFHSLQCRKKHDREATLLFQDTAYQLILQSEEIHDSRPWVEENLRKLPELAKKYRAQLKKASALQPKRVK